MSELALSAGGCRSEQDSIAHCTQVRNPEPAIRSLDDAGEVQLERERQLRSALTADILLQHVGS